MQLTFRKATTEDAARIWEIILQAKAQMLRQNKQQWDETYPLPENIANDIRDGSWLSEQPYVVVHRLAVANEMKQKGIASLFMQKVEELSRSQGIHSFKVDTNFDNFYMHRMLEKLGFSYCGEILYQRGSRMAYEKLL